MTARASQRNITCTDCCEMYEIDCEVDFLQVGFLFSFLIEAGSKNKTSVRAKKKTHTFEFTRSLRAKDVRFYGSERIRKILCMQIQYIYMAPSVSKKLKL